MIERSYSVRKTRTHNVEGQKGHCNNMLYVKGMSIESYRRSTISTV